MKSMKTLGIIGGIGPESTIVYYRSLIAAYRERRQDGSYPPILINSIDVTRMLGLIGANELAGVAEYLLGAVNRLARAGAEVGLLAANTPHVVFDDLQRLSPIPLISIVEAAGAAAKALGLTRLGLFGTRFTMQGRFYAEVFARFGLSLVAPDPDDQNYIHDKYLGEFVPGIFRDETRQHLLRIVDRLIDQHGIDGLILGGTELPLILREDTYRGIPFLDTTKIHVAHAVAHLWP
jgi:aspartate racemase